MPSRYLLLFPTQNDAMLFDRLLLPLVVELLAVLNNLSEFSDRLFDYWFCSSSLMDSCIVEFDNKKILYNSKITDTSELIFV